ncbi:hypothetical protein V8E54_011920 [Elaphomyces granulatus]|jgi:hypothetical protein
MKVSIFSTIFATLLAASSAAPFDAPCQYQIDALHLFDVTVTFNAGPVSFVRKIPADNKPHPIDDNLSVSSIHVDGSALCTFHGVDGSVTHVTGGHTQDVGPPQTQIWAVCNPFPV